MSIFVVGYCVFVKSIFECLYLGRDYKVTYQAAVTPVTLTFLVVGVHFFNNGTNEFLLARGSLMISMIS